MNKRIAEIPPSLIRSLNALKKPGDIDFGIGEPTIAPDLTAFEDALEWTREHGSPYSPNAGFMELRRLIAGYLSTSEGSRANELKAENVCVTIGSEEALYLAIKTVIDPSVDEVLIVEPCYLAYPKICVLEGIAHRMVSLDPVNGFLPSATAVLAAIGPATRMVVINSPCNPTGRVWPAEEIAKLAQGLSARPGPPVYILADDVYRELYYGDEAPAAIGAFYPHTLTAGSLSKSNALTGLRLGWLAGPEEIISGAIKVHQFVNTSATTFSQRVAIALFSREGGLLPQRDHYVAMRKFLLESAAGAGVEIIAPEGAFYALIKLPGSYAGKSMEAAERILREANVVTVPGLAFGESGEGWLRISWVAEPEALREGLERIGSWLSSNC
jgi:aminotransferase